MKRPCIFSLPLFIFAASCIGLFAFIAWISTSGTDDFVTKALAGDLPRILNVPLQDLPFYQRYSELDYLHFAHIGVVLFGGLLVGVAAASLVYLTVSAAKLKLLVYQGGGLIERFGSIALYAALFLTSIFILKLQGYEGSWYRISDAIYFEAEPPFLHRVLFPSIARLLVEFADLNPFMAFTLTQAAVLLALFPIVRRWCRRFGDPEVAVLAPTLLIPFLFALADYYTFYDLGIILFYTIGLTLLLEKRTFAHLFLVPVATLNHENFLLLVLVSGLLHNPFRPNTAFDWRFVALQLVLYTLTRATLFVLLPVHRFSEFGKIWINLHYLSEAATNPTILWKTLLLFVWFGVSALGLVGAPTFLRRASVLLPLLVGITFIFGQLNEARQFAAFVPVALALMMSLVKGNVTRTAIFTHPPEKVKISNF